MAEYPTTMYCLKCKDHTPVKEVTVEATEFQTKKNNVSMKRTTYRGICGKCEKKVSRFAKSDKKEESAPVATQTPDTVPPSA
jgi:hypothetical protein